MSDTEKVYKMLAVLASEDDDFEPWHKLVSHDSIKEKQNMSISSTTYEKFLDGSKKDSFDFVLLVFIGAISADDLEMKQDYFDYYTQVPIVHYAYAKKAQDEEEMKGVKAYLQKTCGKKLFKDKALIFEDLNKQDDCVEELKSHFDDLVSHRDQIYENTVVKSFEKFDKDGNGTIDLQELGQLSALLGQPLD